MGMTESKEIDPSGSKPVDVEIICSASLNKLPCWIQAGSPMILTCAVARSPGE
jgi:hypothetical protein